MSVRQRIEAELKEAQALEMELGDAIHDSYEASLNETLRKLRSAMTSIGAGVRVQETEVEANNIAAELRAELAAQRAYRTMASFEGGSPSVAPGSM